MSAPGARRQRVACVGAYILDVLGRPIDELPRDQRARLIDEIRITAAGSAGGTAVDLARLGADVVAIGARGDDRAGAMLALTLAEERIDTRHLAVKAGAPTSATILPISSDGVRPAWHVPGANALLAGDDVPLATLAGCDAVHYGGITALPALDGAPAAALLAAAQSAGAYTTADCLGVKRDDAWELLEQMLPHVDVFLPNDAEARALARTDDVEQAAVRLRSLGAGAVVVTLGADGALIADDGELRRLPALPGPVVDSTGCGDALCAGVIAGHGLGRSLDDAVRLGIAAATLTLGALGSDGGVRTLADTLALIDQEERACA